MACCKTREMCQKNTNHLANALHTLKLTKAKVKPKSKQYPNPKPLCISLVKSHNKWKHIMQATVKFGWEIFHI